MNLNRLQAKLLQAIMKRYDVILSVDKKALYSNQYKRVFYMYTLNRHEKGRKTELFSTPKLYEMVKTLGEVYKEGLYLH